MSTTDAVADLIATVSVEPAGPDRFTGRGSRNDGVDATFGGHFLGQAVSAALATVEPERRLHSLHAYFLRGGRAGEPYTHQVERVRDGRSFCTRRVRTFQDEGTVQFELMASCAVEEEGPRLAAEPPADFGSLPDPESLPSYGEMMRRLDPLPLPADWALRDYGLDLRTVDAPWAPPGGPGTPSRGIRLWLRTAGPLPADDHHLQSAILAYQSDESLADNIAAPWGATWGSPGVIFVSLDHAMWFHRPVDLNQWHFLDQRVVTVGHGRGLATASLWNQAGELVVSTTQEALLRLDDQVWASSPRNH